MDGWYEVDGQYFDYEDDERAVTTARRGRVGMIGLVLLIIFSLPAQTSVGTVALALGVIALLLAAVGFGGMMVFLNSLLEPVYRQVERTVNDMVKVIGAALVLSAVGAVFVLRSLTLRMIRDRCPECEQGWLKFRETREQEGVAYNVYNCTNGRCGYAHIEKISPTELPAV